MRIVFWTLLCFVWLGGRDLNKCFDDKIMHTRTLKIDIILGEPTRSIVYVGSVTTSLSASMEESC